MTYLETQLLRATTIRVLEALRDHPFLTATQLSWHLRRHSSAVQRQLWQLQLKHWVRRYPLFVDGEQTARWLYTLTTQGIQTLAWAARNSLSAYQQKYGYSISRLRWLALVIERVYQTREVLRYVEAVSGGWSVSRWGSETESRYEIEKGWRWLTFQCSALLVNPEKRWVPLMVEWDSGELAIDAEHARWKNLIQAQSDAEFDYSTDYHFPVLIYVARDAERFDQFAGLVDKIKTERGMLPMPIAYLTDRTRLYPTYRVKLTNELSSRLDAPVWFDTEHMEWVAHALTNCTGNTDQPRVFWQPRPLRKSYASAQIEIEPLDVGSVPLATVNSLAALALALRPLEKKLTNTVGSHPMLTASELAFVLEGAPSKVWEGLKRLRRWQLIKAHPCRVPLQNAKRWDTVHAYTLSDLGLVYLATAAGLGATPKRMAWARGWEKGFNAQVYHAEHTRIGNELFVQLLVYARSHDHTIRWYSEQEARLYLNLSSAEWSGPFRSVRLSPPGNHRESEREEENASEHEGTSTYEGSYSNRNEFQRELAKYGTRFQRFLPDGRAILQVGDQEWHIAVEIDLTRANYHKMLAKLDYYYSLLKYHLDEPNLCILLVTHHWQRARNLYWLAWERATVEIDHTQVELRLADKPWSEVLASAERHAPHELRSQVLPIYITTVEDLRKNGMDQPIWLRVQEGLREDQQLKHTFTKTNCMEYIEQSAKH